MNFKITLFSTLLLGSETFGSSKCESIKQELWAMQKAQQQIMGNLVSNHETFASTLEEYSIVIKQGNSLGRSVISKEMGESAQAFRQRGFQGQRTMLDLNRATQELLNRAVVCIRQH